MVVDSLFLCVCEDRNSNNDGRWQSSRLAELGLNKTDTTDGAEMQDLKY